MKISFETRILVRKVYSRIILCINFINYVDSALNYIYISG